MSDWIQTPGRTVPDWWKATGFMTEQYNKVTKGSSAKHVPRRLILQSDLYKKFVSLFKTLTLHDAGEPGWGFKWEW
jgi:hypothetical protein